MQKSNNFLNLADFFSEASNGQSERLTKKIKYTCDEVLAQVTTYPPKS
jgi:hypothetical protein